MSLVGSVVVLLGREGADKYALTPTVRWQQECMPIDFPQHVLTSPHRTIRIRSVSPYSQFEYIFVRLYNEYEIFSVTAFARTYIVYYTIVLYMRNDTPTNGAVFLWWRLDCCALFSGATLTHLNVQRKQRVRLMWFSYQTVCAALSASLNMCGDWSEWAHALALHSWASFTSTGTTQTHRQPNTH